MTREEATQIASEMGAHSYAYGWVVEALLKGCEIGMNEQKAIDDKKYAKLRKLAMDMYTRASYLSTNGRPLRKAMFAFYRFINFEEKKEDEK